MATAWQRIREVAQAAMGGKPKVALDTCCVQYYISNPPVRPWADCLDPIFRAGLEGKVDLYVSTVVVSELLAHVHFANRNRAGCDPELDLLSILNRHFQILDVNGEVARAAGRLRGNYIPGDRMALKTPDALIGATSVASGHTLFVTNDAQLADALPEANCVFLREAALEHLAERFPLECLDGSAPVTATRRGRGLSAGITLATQQLGSVRPDPAATWKRLLTDAFTVASALAEPCVFFILTEKRGRRVEASEVLFWHEGLNDARPPTRLLRRVQEHLGYSQQTGRVENAGRHVWAFCFTSIARERARQSDPAFASKTDHQRLTDGWSSYLMPLWRFRSGLAHPQTTWLLCEDGVARYLKANDTLRFLNQARNVLGWEDGR
jgi:predicted nucleic acid-binding protein